MNQSPSNSEAAQEEHKYLQVEVTRTQGTLVFLKVPKEFSIRSCVNLKAIITAAAVETCDEDDWKLGSYGWEESVEWTSIKEVPKAEAESYEVYEVRKAAG